MPHQVKAQLITAHRQVRKNPFIIKTKCKHCNAAVIDHKAVKLIHLVRNELAKRFLLLENSQVTSEKRQIVLQVFLNKLSKDLKLGRVTWGMFSMHPFDNNHVTGTIKFQTLKLTYLLLINFLSTRRRWWDGNWPHKCWSLIKLSRSLIFSRPVSLSSLLTYVVVGLPRLPSLPCVGGGWTGKRIGGNFLKIFLSGFWIQSEILTDFWILQLQQIADSSTFWAWILDFTCN